MSIYTIYKATNTINGKSYIGFDSNWPRRQKQHFHKAKSGEGQYFHNAIRKDGWENFVWEILYQSLDANHCLNEMENYFIVEYKTFGNNGYNLTLGGEGNLGYSPTKETKAKMSAAKKLQSKETKAKISANHKGKIAVRHIESNECFIIDKENFDSLVYVGITKNMKHSVQSEKLKGTIMVKDNDGNIFRTTKDDPRFVSGNLVGIRKGTIQSPETKQKISDTFKRKRQTILNSSFSQYS